MNLLEKLLGRVRPRPPHAGTPATDGASRSSQVADTIDRALNAAGLTQQGGLGGNVRATIDQSLARAGLARPMQPAPATAPPAARERAPAPNARPAAGGAWLARTFRNDVGALDYKLYVPSGPPRGASAPMPLVVMLHGCTQSPDDFAAGTGMNALAYLHGFLVAYPAQTPRANGNKCWNWFRPGDQAHGRGEPSLIAGIVGDVAADHRVDPQRVFVAGLSAGAAMAVILGETYPDVFAAVGAHSGLPFAAAHDMGSAFTAMSAGAPGKAGSPRVRSARRAVPTIVFHGDADHTVAPSNGEAIVRDATAGTTQSSTHAGVAPGGRSYTQEVFDGTAGRARAEHWTVHGAGHAWSGGSERGTYTDPSGPDASAEMVRFFLQQPGNAQRATSTAPSPAASTDSPDPPAT